jgi:hypothetical protein
VVEFCAAGSLGTYGVRWSILAPAFIPHSVLLW